jgi:hypothetical protein
VIEENLIPRDSNGGSLFGGYPSLEERDKSFDIKDSMTVHCGYAHESNMHVLVHSLRIPAPLFSVANLMFSRFVRGKIPGINTGFDIDEADLFEMQQCQRTVVASAIFGNYFMYFSFIYNCNSTNLSTCAFSGNYDIMQQPENISEFSKNTVCFFMFLDEETEAAIKNSSNIDHTKRIGLWRVVVVSNLPYSDARRNGKVSVHCCCFLFSVRPLDYQVLLSWIS